MNRSTNNEIITSIGEYIYIYPFTRSRRKKMGKRNSSTKPVDVFNGQTTGNLLDLLSYRTA
jgi:hypothetical protein